MPLEHTRSATVPPLLLVPDASATAVAVPPYLLLLLPQDDLVVVIPDIRPAAAVHLLVIPKAHIPNVSTLAGPDVDLGEAPLRTASLIVYLNAMAICSLFCICCGRRSLSTVQRGSICAHAACRAVVLAMCVGLCTPTPSRAPCKSNPPSMHVAAFHSSGSTSEQTTSH